MWIEIDANAGIMQNVQSGLCTTSTSPPDDGGAIAMQACPTQGEPSGMCTIYTYMYPLVLAYVACASP